MFLNRSLSSSVPITATASSTSISDAVSSSNSANIYKFNLAQRSSLNLLASGLSADVNMAIVRDSNANGIVNDGEILGRSENAGTTIENIQLANLAAGSYFIIVEAGANVTNANYSLSFGTSKASGADILWRDTDNDQVGYWRFDGTTYRDTKVITPISDDWKVEAIGDFDGDKSEDILWRNKVNGELVAYLMDGASGTIRSQATLKNPTTGATWPVDQSWQVIGIGDVNGDGKGDIIWRNAAAEAVSIWVMNGTQVVGATPPVANGVGLTVGAGFNLVAVADLTGDGKADLLWQHSSGVVISWVMDGANRAGAVTMSNQPTAGYKIEAVNDFNGDGKADLFWRNSVGNVQMWLGTGQVDAYQVSGLSSTSNLPVSNVSLAFQIAGTDDFNGDGKADIVWRHDTGVLSLWSMNGSQVNYMENVAIPVLSQKPVGASTRLETANIIQLAGISDSGESNSDWITNVRAPSFAGVTSAGSTVSLFGNNQLIGETKATANGTWSIVTTTLDDGIYDISQKVTNTAGAFTQQILPKKLMIDGTAADLQITGPIDGVAWDSQVELAGYSYDLDPQAKVEYSVKADGTLVFSAVLSAAVVAPPTPTFLTKKTIGTTSIALGQATGSQIFKPYEIGLKVTDRAGNISTQTYKGMRLNLPELTEEGMLLPDTVMPTLPDERNSANPTDPNNANNPNDSGGGRLYIGAGGGWGYGTTSGTGGWNWNSSANSSPSTIPTHVLNPNEVIGYLPALRLALTTARDVLSNVPATARKKDSLKQHLEMLMKMGEVIESNGLYEAMRPMLKSVFATAYAPNGITKRQSIVNGWELAKSLALETKLTTLQIFQANLYASSLVALKQNGNTAPIAGLQQTIEALASTYARFQTARYEYVTYNTINPDFLGALLYDGRVSPEGGQIDRDLVIQRAIADLKGHLLGQADPVHALQLVDRLLQATTQVRQIHEDGYNYQTWDNWGNYYWDRASSSITDKKFLDRLSDLAFDIARCNPTVTAGANPTSEWIETLWEGGNLQSAAGGLSDWFSSFRVEKPVNPDYQAQIDYGKQMQSARSLSLKALDYADRLVQADRLLAHDPLLGGEVLKADFLSHLLNLGGAYAALNPSNSIAPSDAMFFAKAWTGSSLADIASQLRAYLLQNEFPVTSQKKVLEYERDIFATYLRTSRSENFTIPYVPTELGGGIGGPNSYQGSYGTLVHGSITLDYTLKHPNQRVFGGNQINTILKEYQKDLQISYDLSDKASLSQSERILRPDIFVYSNDSIYEIKNFKEAKQGYQQVTNYINVFSKANINVKYGASTESDPTLYGVVQAPDIGGSKSWAIYHSPRSGVIVYKGIKLKDAEQTVTSLDLDEIQRRIEVASKRYGVPVFVLTGLLVLWEAARVFPLRNLIPIL
jgi:Bacterial Ig-like domain/FG-GAP-like repeat